MGAQDTLIPTGGPRTGPFAVVQEPQPKGEPYRTTDPYAATVVALAGAVRAGRGGAILAGVLAGLVSSAALWGLHDAVGGREEAKRLDSLEDRLDKLEQQQKWERWALTSIAQKVGAELPPKDP